MIPCPGDKPRLMENQMEIKMKNELALQVEGSEDFGEGHNEKTHGKTMENIMETRTPPHSQITNLPKMVPICSKASLA